MTFKTFKKRFKEVLLPRLKRVPKDLRELAGRRNVIVGAVLLPLFLVLSFSDLGVYLNQALYYEPVLKARARLGLAPQLDERIRLVLVEDSSLQKMQRQPTFGEWQGIASRLFDLGYEKVILHSFPDLVSDVGELAPHDPRGEIIAGSVAYPFAGNPRAMTMETLPRSVMLDATAGGTEALSEAKFVMGPAPRVLSLINKMGSLNTSSSISVPLAYRSGHTVIPTLGLLASPKLAWTEAGFVNAGHQVPTPFDGLIYVDFVEPRSVLNKTLAVRFLFENDGEKLLPNLPKRVQERLSGGKVAILVPEAYTGARFIETPLGIVPSYMMTASMASSTLHNFFIFHPVRSWIILIFFAPLLALLLCRPTKVALTSAALLGVLTTMASMVMLVEFGWLLPTAEAMILTIAGWLTRAAYHLVITWADKLRLSNELAMGQTVQSLLLPKELGGKLGRWEYKVVFRPHGPMSGDWVQIFKSEDRVNGFDVIAIGDVVGKGPSAALNTAAIASVWSQFSDAWAAGNLDVAVLIQTLNAAIRRTFKGVQNSSISLAVIHKDKISITAGGAPPWQVIRADHQIERLRVPPANPMGIDAKAASCKPVELEPRPGDVFIAYSDGVMDGMASRRRFQELMSAEAPLSDSERIFELVTDTATRAGKVDILPDDFTLLMLRFVPDALDEERPSGPADPARAA